MNVVIQIFLYLIDVEFDHFIYQIHLLLVGFFFSLDTSLKFTRLEKLTLDNIASIIVERILTHFISSSYLFSLVINCIDSVQNTDKFYRQIFRLPVLKYCKLSSEGGVSYMLRRVATNKYSSIEYLVITHCLLFHELMSLLSYVP